VQTITAQTINDKELLSLIENVKRLRKQNEATYNDVTRQLAADIKWTPMNETGALREQECRPSDNVHKFKLNRILNRIDGSRKYVSTHGDMLNGEDKRYNYSLYERSVKKGNTVSYKMKGRKGKQIFVIVPFAGKSSGLLASISFEKNSHLPFSISADGTLTVSCKIRPDEEFLISITNKGKQNQSFVLINYNSRNDD
jgi:hypothetical protein